MTAGGRFWRSRAELIYGLTAQGGLISFESATPATVTTVDTLTGASAGQFFLNIDFRPANGLLYGLAVNTITGASLYNTINTSTAAATMVGSTQFTLSVSIGSRVAMDFNPVTDQARVVSRGSNYQVTFRATASRLFLSNSGSRGELSLVFPKLSLRLVSIRLRGGVILACTLLCAVSAKADWTVTRSEPHSGKDGLVTRVAVSVEDNKSGDTAQLQFAVFDTKKATVRVLDQPTEPRVSLAEMMQTEKCLAGVNGGYFDPEHAAVGLLITAGQTVQSKQRAKLLSGVVSDMGGRFQIERAAAFSPKKKPTEARQCGPFLVERGRAITGLNGTRSARRSFVMAAAKGRAAIGYSSSVTLAQLGDILATPDLVAELQVQSALNLDGGSSSGFWFAGSEGAFALREYKTVRDFIGIVAR